MTDSSPIDGSWGVETRDQWSLITYQPSGDARITHRDVEQLDRILSGLEADRCRVVILTGRDGVFIEHADLRDLEAMARGEPTTGDPMAWVRVCKRLDRGPMVSIAAINGACGGGGWEIALTCSLRIASELATFNFPEAGLGLVPAVAAHRAIAATSEGQVLDLLLTGRVLTASDALAWGLVSRVCSASELFDIVSEVVEAIVSVDPEVVEGIRALVRQGRNPVTPDVMSSQSRLWSDLVSRPGGLDRVEQALLGGSVHGLQPLRTSKTP